VPPVSATVRPLNERINLDETNSEKMQKIWPPAPARQPLIERQNDRGRNPTLLGVAAFTTILLALLFVGAVHWIACQPNTMEQEPLVYRIQYEHYRFGSVLSFGYFVGAVGFLLSISGRRERLGQISLIVGLLWFVVEVGIRLGLPLLYPIPPQIL
jgi:hypothetical protein